VTLRRKCNGAKRFTEAVDVVDMVGERSKRRRSRIVRCGGVLGSENAGMSSEKRGENPLRRKPKGS
jgi:hypothetical protein